MIEREYILKTPKQNLHNNFDNCKVEQLRVLIACEFSGIVREAFKARGHYAMSCDLLPTEIPGEHYQGDVRDILNDNWDLMIAHPPCTYLSYVGNSWLNISKYGEKAIERKRKREEALIFFMELYNAPIDKICIENPKGYPMQFIKPSQIIQPYYFGDSESKRTCLWLKNLPLLYHIKEDNLFENKTHVKPVAKYFYKTGRNKGKPITFNDSFPPSKDRAKLRSKTFQGIANAMAEQWG